MIDELIEKIDLHNIITFDVFDTLIVRNVRDAKDIFHIVQSRFQKRHQEDSIDFYSCRIEAEDRARKACQYREVNIDEIYECLAEKIGVDKANEYKNIETQVEIQFCQVNKEVLPYYEYALEHQKKIYIISDMYFPASVINKILTKNHVAGFKKIYSSCDYRITKWEEGKLFKKFCQDEQVLPKEVLHIGNDKKADFLQARRQGLDSYLIYPPESRIQYYNKKQAQGGNLPYNCLVKMMEHNEDFSAPLDFRLGYEAFGPLLAGYLCWLSNQVDLNNIKKVFFLSRDGYILRKGFQLLRPDIDSTYFYASRRSIIVPTLKYDCTLQEMTRHYKSWSRTITLEQLALRLGIYFNQLRQSYSYFNLDKSVEVSNLLDDSQISSYFQALLPAIKNNAEEQYTLFSEYIKQEKMGGKIAIVDIGAACTIEYAFREFISKSKLPISLIGLYLHKKGPMSDNSLAYFSSGSGSKYQTLLRFCYMFLEVILSAPHGTVLGYKKERGSIAPIFAPFEYENHEEDASRIKRLQEGALAFIKDYKEYLAGYVDMTNDLSFENFKIFALIPTYKDATSWGEFHFFADKFLPMAVTKGIWQYIVHPKEFIHDFKDSLWPSGFLMRTFHSQFLVKLLVSFYNILK